MAREKKLNKQAASGSANEDYAEGTWDRIQKSRNVAEQTAKIHQARQPLKGQKSEESLN